MVWDDVCAHYRAQGSGTQYGSLTLKSFCSPDKPTEAFPVLKGSGAEAKDLLPALREIWHVRAKRHKQYALIDGALAALVDWQDILSENSDHVLLPIGAVERLQRCTDDFLLRYQKLAYTAERQGLLLWSQPTKFHWMFHLSRKAMYLNPRRASTFIDEDFVGKLKVVLQSCAAGTELHAVCGRMVEKYRWGLHFLTQQ